MLLMILCSIFLLSRTSEGVEQIIFRNYELQMSLRKKKKSCEYEEELLDFSYLVVTQYVEPKHLSVEWSNSCQVLVKAMGNVP